MPRHLLRALTMFLAALVPAAANAAEAGAQPASPHETGTVTDADDPAQQLHYLIALPDGYAGDDEAWPLILFLHGAGERGDDIEKVKKWGPPRLIEAGESIPAIVVSPQCPADKWWGGEQLTLLSALLDQIERDYRVDPSRVYLTGLSMGGFGTWSLAAREPDRFAAIVPICGRGDERLAATIAEHQIPVWNFHGEADNVVDVESSRKMQQWLEDAGHKSARFTYYPDVGHNSWKQTYADPAVWDWLFAQRRPAPEATEPAADHSGEGASPAALSQ